nr:HEAT repeat domain-containing protein [Planctomycetota bacterium]
TLRDHPDAREALVKRVLSATPRQRDVLAVLMRGNDRRSHTVAFAVAGAVNACSSDWELEGMRAAEELDPILLLGAVQREPVVARVCQTALDRMRPYDERCRQFEPPAWHALLASHVAIMTTPELARLTSWLADSYERDYGEGSAVIAFLEAQLDDPDPVVARAALSGLCWRGSPAIGHRLIDVPVDDDSTGFTNAWFTSVRDPAAGPALARMLTHADHGRRLGSVIAIARCRAVAQVSDLITVLDQDVTLRAPVLLTLAELRQPSALASFVAALHDDDPMMRLLAARGIAGLPGDDGVAVLRAAALDDPVIALVAAQSAAR